MHALTFFAQILTNSSKQPMNPAMRPYFITFLVIYMVLAISAALFFKFNRNVGLKRLVLPPFIALMFALIGCLLAYTSYPHLERLYFIGPALLLIAILKIRMTRFCDSCGRTLSRKSLFGRSNFCSSCGAVLK